MISPDKFLKSLIKSSCEKTAIHGAYYTAFGVFGTIIFLLPYFLWSHDFDTDYQTLTLRIIASILCFNLVIMHQTRIWEANNLVKLNLLSSTERQYTELEIQSYTNKIIHGGLLPLYWHFTLCFCLPIMTTLNLLKSSFDITWVIHSALSIFTLALLVDWISFIIILFIGIIFGYLVYTLWTGNIMIVINDNHLFLVIYMYLYVLLVGVLFLYHKEKILFEKNKTNLELEKLNATLDEKVKQRTTYLKRVLKFRAEFLNNISHEIRTPLQGIIGISTTLYQHWANFSDEERFSYIKVIADSGDRLLNLLSNLLDLSKFEAGKMLFDFKIANLVDTIKNEIELMKPLYFGKDTSISFSYKFSKNNYNILYDEDRIKQVISNFISNALKYSDYEDIDITLTMIDAQDKERDIKSAQNVLVKIEDRGIGIPESELLSVFLPFSQSSRTKSKAGGTGLGLSLCAEIVHAHKGKIWVKNNPNGIGCSFYFTLPIKLDEKIPTIKSNLYTQNVNNFEAKKIAQAPAAATKKYKILFVDDEVFCRMSGKVILESSDYEVITADGGLDALEKLKHEKFDLVLLDLMMPDMYGTEVLSKIRQNPELVTLPVILQSGTSDYAQIAQAKSLGIKDIVIKPYNKDAILSIIEKALKS